MTPLTRKALLRGVYNLERQLNISVLYMDRQTIVLNKKEGMVTQATSTIRQNESITPALQDLQKYLQLSEIPLTVHRLDKPTTGTFVLARTPQSAKNLSQQFREDLVKKSYLALLKPSNLGWVYDNEGEITTGYTDKNGRGRIVSVGKGTKEARTGYNVLARSSEYPVWLAKFQLHTGLKHQLRLHASSILKAPILGDHLYSAGESSSRLPLAIPNHRLFLHSSSISFTRHVPHPHIPKRHVRAILTLTSPLPSDFHRLLTKLNITNALTTAELLTGDAKLTVPNFDESVLQDNCQVETLEVDQTTETVEGQERPYTYVLTARNIPCIEDAVFFERSIRK